MSSENIHPIIEQDVDIAFPPKQPIQCLKIMSSDSTEHSPNLIFTHGAGGTLKSEAILNFANGFARVLPLLCFKGNMNLKSRVNMFTAVIDELHAPRHLGGRSMGARAAVMAATEQTTHLVLVSYPLHTEKETRDQILLDLPEAIQVVFVSGDGDSMCDLQRLQEVREKMKCRSWLVVVEAADHSMNVKPKAGTEAVGRKTGEIVAEWLGGYDKNATESRISWNAEDEIVQWSGWSNDQSIPLNISSTETAEAPKSRKRKCNPETSASTQIAPKKKKQAKGHKRK